MNKLFTTVNYNLSNNDSYYNGAKSKIKLTTTSDYHD